MLFRGYVQVCLEVSLQFIFGRAGAHLEASLRLACSAKVKGCFALGCLVMRFLSGSVLSASVAFTLLACAVSLPALLLHTSAARAESKNLEIRLVEY